MKQLQKELIKDISDRAIDLVDDQTYRHWNQFLKPEAVEHLRDVIESTILHSLP